MLISMHLHSFAQILSFLASTVPVIMASPLPPLAGTPLSSMSEEHLPTIVFMKYGPDLEVPWSRRELAKDKFKVKIAALQPELASKLVLTKVHILQNGWALNLFFMPVPEALHSQLLEVVQRWTGNGGQARFLDAEEIGRQVVADVHFKIMKRKESESLGNLEQMTSLMCKCLDLQGKPADRKDVARAQRKTSGLVVQCVERAQAQKEKEVNKRFRSEAPKASSDSE